MNMPVLERTLWRPHARLSPQPSSAVRIGLINNPLSRSNRARGVAHIADLAGSHGVEVASEVDMSGLSATLARFAEAGVNLLAINGGDGTVRNVLTQIWRDRPFETPPMLAVLRGGRSNAIAMDCGLRGAPDSAFRRLLAAAAEGKIIEHIVERKLIRVEGVQDAGVQYGMFMVAAGGVPVIDYSRSRIDPLGLPAWISDVISLAGVVTRSLRRRNSLALDGHDIAGDVDGAPLPFSHTSLLLAFTLDTLVLRSRPYWNEQTGPLRLTLMAHPPRGMVWRLPALLYGGATRDAPEDQYFSRGASAVTLRFNGRFVLDGEFFEASADTPLRLYARETARFIVL